MFASHAASSNDGKRTTDSPRGGPPKHLPSRSSSTWPALLGLVAHAQCERDRATRAQQPEWALEATVFIKMLTTLRRRP